MANKKYSMDMTRGHLVPQIISFTLPLIASSLLQLLFNAADMVVAGKFAGPDALAAIGSTGSLINLLVCVFMGLSVGTNVLVARFYGSGKGKDVSETVHTSVLLAIICGILLTAIGFFWAPSLLAAMDTPETILPLSVLYIRIYFFGMPVSLLYNFASAVLRAIGDTKRPLIYLAVAGALNFICNVIFIVVFGMGVDGVAYATVLSQTLSAVLVVIALVKTDECYRVIFKELKITKDKFVQILRLGVPAGLQGGVFSFSNVLIQSSINSFGPAAMAGNTAAANIEGFVYVAMNAFHHTCLSFTSQNYGANNFDRIKKICYTCLSMVFAVGLVLGLTCYFAGPPLLSIYADKESVASVIEYGMRRINIIMLTYYLCGMMDVMVGAIRGLGYSVMPTIVSLCGACLFRIIYIYTVFKSIHTMECLFISYPISWALTFGVHVICYLIAYKKKRTVLA